MRLRDAMKLMEKYAACETCGSEMIGNGAGVMDIGENHFTRSCKCGWKIEIQDGQEAPNGH